MKNENLFLELDYDNLVDFAGIWATKFPMIKGIRLYKGRSDIPHVLVFFIDSGDCMGVSFTDFCEWCDEGCFGNIANDICDAYRKDHQECDKENFLPLNWVRLIEDPGDNLDDPDSLNLIRHPDRYWQLYPICRSKDQGQASGDRNPDTRSAGEENLDRIADAIIPELDRFMQGAIKEYGNEFYGKLDLERQKIIIDFYNDRRAGFPNIEESMFDDIGLYRFDQAHAERFKAKLLVKILRKKGHQVKNYQALWDKVKNKRA